MCEIVRPQHVGNQVDETILKSDAQHRVAEQMRSRAEAPDVVDEPPARALGRNEDEVSAIPVHGGLGVHQGLEFGLAERTPLSPEEARHDRAGPQQIREHHEAAVGTRQSKVGRLIADLSS